jgi:hypothetical protein
MHLQRIQVPDFRVLKDVDITFENEFIPSIFPIGSLNGGGKSTLLQLIFVLLHCSMELDRIEFIKNMLDGLKIYDNHQKRVLAIVDIWHENKTVRIEFSLYKESYFGTNLSQAESNKTEDFYVVNFSCLEKIQKLKAELSKKKELQRKSEKFLDELQKLENEYKDLENASLEILQHLQSEELIYIGNYSANKNKEEKEALLCKVDNVDVTEAEFFLKELSKKVFLTAPATQVFLFLPKKTRKLLFRNQMSEFHYYTSESYSSNVETTKSQLPGFFTYDFLPVDLLVESFKAARDKDFREAIETGEYGNNYKKLIEELNFILLNKKINLDLDFSGINFKLNRDGDNIELQPEDLSHGELKRLSIYMWMKYHNIENSIVLMDEIEIAFHPDWQYQIISDLQQWAPSNQYILATHSYELCQALTPSHVKELEPKLLKQEAQ